MAGDRSEMVFAHELRELLDVRGSDPHATLVVGPVDDPPQGMGHVGAGPLRDVDEVDAYTGLVERLKGPGVQQLVRGQRDG